MKKIILVFITVLLIINAIYPKSFMGRMYIYDLEKFCNSEESLDMRFKIFFKHKYTTDWNTDDKVYFHIENEYGDGKLNALTIHTSDEKSCYVYENGIIEYKMDKHSVKADAFSNVEIYYDFLTDEEAEVINGIFQEAKVILHNKINDITNNYLEKIHTRYILTIAAVLLFWLCYALIYIKKYKKQKNNSEESNNDV